MAKLGTPENPEIIEPGQRPRPTAPTSNRLKTAFKLTKSLAFAVAPAILFDWAMISLLSEGWRDQNAISLLLGVLLFPPAALSTVLAMIAGPLLFMSLVFLAFGRPVSLVTRQFGRPAAGLRFFS